MSGSLRLIGSTRAPYRRRVNPPLGHSPLVWYSATRPLTDGLHLSISPPRHERPEGPQTGATPYRRASDRNGAAAPGPLFGSLKSRKWEGNGGPGFRSPLASTNGGLWSFHGLVVEKLSKSFRKMVLTLGSAGAIWPSPDGAHGDQRQRPTGRKLDQKSFRKSC